MNIRSLIAVLSVAILTGCWPYLGDPYESYVDGDSDSDDPDPDTRIPDPDTEDPDTEDPDTDPDTLPPGDGPPLMGWIEITEVLGTYFDSSQTNSFFGAVAGRAAQQEFSYGDQMPARGTCSQDAAPLYEMNELAVDIGLPANTVLTFAGSQFGLTASDDGPDMRFDTYSFPSAAPSNSVLTITGSVDAGGIGGTITRSASDFSVTAPAGINGGDLLTVSRDPITISWSGTGSDRVFVTAFFFHPDLTNEDNDPTTQAIVDDFVDCTPTGNSITFDPDDYASENSTAFRFYVTRLRTYDGQLSGSARATTSVDALLTKFGEVDFNE